MKQTGLIMTASRTYEVVATRDGKWWALHVTGLDMGFSQARRLADIEPTVRDLIAALTDTAADTFDVTVRVDVPEAAMIETAAHLQAEAATIKQAADAAMIAAARALVARDIPVRDVATMLHVSPGWVSVLTRESAA